MNYRGINARIKRNGLIEFAGLFFRSNESDIVRNLNSTGKKAILGIQNNTNQYTIIGENYVYFSTNEGEKCEIKIDLLLEILQKNARSKGKKGDFYNIIVDNKFDLWLNNANTMNAIWNTLLFINDINKSV
jgi:hypothetical protein